MLSAIEWLDFIETMTLCLAVSFKSTNSISVALVYEVKPNFLGLISLKSFLKALMVSLTTEVKFP